LLEEQGAVCGTVLHRAEKVMVRCRCIYGGVH
jgi:hypothetical protein